MSRIQSRLARLEALAVPGDDDLRAWARRPLTEAPDWVLLSIMTGRRFTPEEAQAMQDCPELDQEIEAYLAKVRVAAEGAPAGRANFARSLSWLEERCARGA